jgi:hypothetical protein
MLWRNKEENQYNLLVDVNRESQRKKMKSEENK